MDEVLSGFRIGGAILWAWMLWRVLFESADIHRAPDPVRRAGWVYFRWFIVSNGFATAFFLAPENILRIGGHISREVSVSMLTGGSFLVLLGAILIHHGLDIATERPSNSIAVYVVLALACVAFGLVGGWL